MTIINCPNCGGTHYGSLKCPYTKEPCVICGDMTVLACSDCAIDSGGKEAVHVCEKRECRDKHEAEKHSSVTTPSPAAPSLRQALKPCPFCCGEATLEQTEDALHNIRWTVGCNEREKDDGAILCYGYQSLTTFATKREATEAWNRRAALAADEGGWRTAGYAIWWLSQAACEDIGPELPSEWPDYIKQEYRDRLGRAGRGRLWCPRHIPLRAIDWNDASPLARAAGQAGGIVIEAKDAALLCGWPGFITTPDLMPWRPLPAPPAPKEST